MDINKEFDSAVLQQGRQYYRAGRVKNIKRNGYGYQADVIDSIVYNVKVLCIDRLVMDVGCSCLEALDGKRCKHQAAVLYALELIPENVEYEDKKLVKPFATMKNMQKDYAYFDMDWMTRNFAFTEEVCKKAQKLLKSKSVVLERVDIGYRYGSHGNEFSQLFGIAYGYFVNKKDNPQVMISFYRDGIESARCEVANCCNFYSETARYGRKTLCEHQVALLYLIAAHLVEQNPGDATDYTGSKLLNNFQKQHAMQVMSNAVETEKNVRLEPRLEKNFDGLKLGFRIGDAKLFVVKSMTDLVTHVDNGKTLQLGSTSSLDFNCQSFVDASLPYYEIIESVVKEENYRKMRDMSHNEYYDEKYYEVKNNIFLQGKILDAFFETAQNQEIDYTDKCVGSKKEKLILKDKNPSLHLKVKKINVGSREDAFDGVEVEGTISDLIEGVKYVYFIEENCLYRAKKDEIKELMPFVKMAYNGKVAFRIGRRKLSQFYYSLLPVLRKYGTVEEVDAQEIEEYLPPEVTFKFYLDVENGELMCQPRACYGEEKESPLDDNRANVMWKSWRDRNREAEINYRLSRIFPEIDLERDLFCTGDNEEVIYEAMENGIPQLFSLGEVHSTERFRNMNVSRKPKITVGVSVESDIMNLSIMTDDISMEELLDALNSYRRKKKYHRLKNGDFMSVNEENMEALAQMMDSLHITPKEFVKGKMEIPTYRALYLDKMLEQSDGIYAKRDGHFKKLLKEFKTVNDSDYEVPESLQKIMRNYQVTGYKWLRTLAACGFGGILADDMGLGKTLQMIAVLLAAKQEDTKQVSEVVEVDGQEIQTASHSTSLIVAPASLVYNWYEECMRFAPELKVNLIVGTQKERAEKIKDYKNWDVLVTSYDLLKRDITEYEDCRFLYQVLDEAQYIKNHSTAASKAVKVIKSKTRFALTGTPIENRLSELWSIFDYLMPGFLYKYEVFRREMENPVVKNKDEKITERLKKMVSPFILRRVKQDVLKDLPAKLEEVRYAKLDDRQRKLYDGQVSHMKQMLAGQQETDFQKNKMKVLAELTRIRQICCDPSLLFENYDGGSAKRDACMELVQSAIEGEHKVLIFSQFTSMLELLEKDLTEANISYYKITGETPKQKRVELVKEYNENEVPVFLISLKAGGTGLNLTGADVVIHYDPWWNLAVQNQATDRAHRIGQNKVVVVYKLIAKDSIEEKIVQMQETKKNLADEILSGEMGGLSGLNKDELLELIG